LPFRNVSVPSPPAQCARRIRPDGSCGRYQTRADAHPPPSKDRRCGSSGAPESCTFKRIWANSSRIERIHIILRDTCQRKPVKLFWQKLTSVFGDGFQPGCPTSVSGKRLRSRMPHRSPVVTAVKRNYPAREHAGEPAFPHDGQPSGARRLPNPGITGRGRRPRHPRPVPPRHPARP
jgi:hypothetical protein